MSSWRCTALSGDLDGEGHSRTCEHARLVSQLLGSDVAWSEYGITKCRVSLCRMYYFTFELCLNLSMQPFTDDFPRADIHILLAPDLLHQLIKGVFKDHLVEWVHEYLKLVHGPQGAATILDDIDRR